MLSPYIPKLNTYCDSSYIASSGSKTIFGQGIRVLAESTFTVLSLV